MIPINDTGRFINKNKIEITNAISNCLDSGWFLNGLNTKKFSEKFSKYTNSEYCLLVGNGTDSLELALKVLKKNNENKNEVITVANAGGYTTSACVIQNLKPVYVDIEQSSLLMDIDEVIRELNPSTLAVVATHLFGSSIDIPFLRERMDQAGYKNIFIVEDCAQAHGSKLRNKHVGSFGDIGTFSFYPTKNLGSIGDAGAIVTSNKSIYNDIKKLHQYGWSEKYKVDLCGGRNSRIDEIQAAYLNFAISKLNENILKRKEILDLYRSETSFLFPSQQNENIPHLAVLITEKRDELNLYLNANDISTDIHYPILDCEQKGWKDIDCRISQKGLQESKLSINKILTIPCFPELTESEVNHIINVLNKWRD